MNYFLNFIQNFLYYHALHALIMTLLGRSHSPVSPFPQERSPS